MEKYSSILLMLEGTWEGRGKHTVLLVENTSLQARGQFEDAHGAGSQVPYLPSYDKNEDFSYISFFLSLFLSLDRSHGPCRGCMSIGIAAAQLAKLPEDRSLCQTIYLHK